MNDSECLPGETATHLSETCLKAYAKVLDVDASLATTAATNFGALP
jgi:hypothetical protein